MEQEYKYMVCTACATYNQSLYIVDALNGFTMQKTTFPVITIIVDDASTDGEPDVIKQYLADYFQTPYRTEETDDYHLICATHKTNPNCNFIVFLLKYNHYSIKKSKLPYQTEWRDNAKYIALCEGDDYWIDPQKLQKQVDFLDAHPDFGCVGTVCKSYVQLEDRYYEAAQQKEQEVTFEDLLFDTGFATCSSCFRTELEKEHLREVPLKWMMGDYPRWLYFATRSRVYRLGDVTSVYRVISGSASHPTNPQQALDFKLSSMDCTNFFVDKYGLSEDKKQKLYLEGAENLLRRGISWQYRPFITASMEYKKRHGLTVGFRDYFYDFLLSNAFTKAILAFLKEIKLYVRKNLLKNAKR